MNMTSTLNYTDRYIGKCKCGQVIVLTGLPTFLGMTTKACECGLKVKLGQVIGAYSTKKCDARCLNAKRSACDCSCGGANHGGGH